MKNVAPVRTRRRQTRATAIFSYLRRRLRAILGGFWDSKTRPRRPKMAPRWAKMAPRRPKIAPRRTKQAPRRPKIVPRRSKTAPRRSKTRPRRFQNTILGILELSWEGFGRPRRAQDGPRWRASEARERAKRAKRAERRHAVPSRPRRCDRTAIKREIQENRETGRAEDHMF